MLKELCAENGCPNYGRYCRSPFHTKKTVVNAPPPEKEKKPIPKESAERKEQNKVYKKVKKELNLEQPSCQIMIKDVCEGTPVHPQHIKGRTGKNFTDKESMINSCNPCNRWIMEHPALAKELGFEKSRLEMSEKRKHLYLKNNTMTTEEIKALTCDKHVKIYLMSLIESKAKVIAEALGTNTGNVYNVLKEYKAKPEKVAKAEQIAAGLNLTTESEKAA
jgi:hypothetical protein